MILPFLRKKPGTEGPGESRKHSTMDILKLQAELRKTRRQLMVLYEVGNLMRMTLKLDEIIFLILSAVTSHEGLGFNRAVLFLVDENRQEVRGVFAIGPADPKESMTVWKDIDEHKLHLDGFIDVYRKSKGQIDPQLNQIVQGIRFPLQEDRGIVARTVLEGMPFAALNDAARAELQDETLDKLLIDHFVAVPVKGKDQIIGALIADNPSTKKPISKEEILNLTMLADHAGLAMENAMVFNRVLEISKKDSLTDLWNHAHFQELLMQSLQVAKLQHNSLSLVLFDVDDFKRYNDQLGHQQGDRALQAISKISRSVLRKNDYIARYGGEEFAAIFPGTSKDEAVQLADKLRKAIEKQTSGIFNSNTIKQVTISGGVATYPEDAEEREKLIYCSDAALYEAKRIGKNRIAAYRKV